MVVILPNRGANLLGTTGENVGISNYSVSRRFFEASARELGRLAAQRFDPVDLLIIF
jgi:hypothetical protein